MSLYNRGTSYYAVLNVPTAFRSLVGKRQLWVSLRTKNKQIAQRRYIVVMSDLYERLDFKEKTAKKMGYDKDEHTLDYDRIRAARASELPAKKGKRKKTEVDSQL